MDYDDILNRTWDDIPQPQLLPDGQWLVTGGNVAFFKPKEEGQSARVLFNYKAKSPVSVGEDLIDELGDYDISINDLQYQIFIENAADWDKVRKHLAKHGVKLEGRLFVEGSTKFTFAKAFRGTEVVATVGQRSYENNAGETVWQNTLTGFTSVED